ncbi:MAG: hypothetical protein B6242_06685 [Anaerolineaceae bacterium 4572_78]|nr:MAG: hypothetical protein B6242_06685 [Anaerolineaceae bacterium 4572_78]
MIIADDEKQVHNVTKYVLNNFSFDGKKLLFLSAYTGKEAKKLVDANSDAAIILLDVVMETSRAGLDVARYIRKTLKNSFIRIILRTGQPGEAPEESVILEYNINEYKNKTELTHQKLFTTLITALRSYQDLITIEANRKELEIRNIQIGNMYDQLQIEIAKRKEKDKFFSIIAHDLTAPFQPLLSLSKTLASKAPTYTSRQIKSSCDLYNDVNKKTIIYADENMLNMVIRNLISNAIKFTPQGKSIAISAKPQGKLAIVSVTDTGVGMSQEKVEGLFRIDVNSSTRGTDGEIGTGLGLIMCQEMVEKNGGKIWLESELEKGTSVKFTVPLDSISIVDEIEMVDIDVEIEIETEVFATKKQLIPPPPQEMEMLYDFAMSGDMDGVQSAARYIAKLDEKYIPFTEKLMILAEEFDDDRILKLIEQFM